jgi:hypothetical protein
MPGVPMMSGNAVELEAYTVSVCAFPPSAAHVTSRRYAFNGRLCLTDVPSASVVDVMGGACTAGVGEPGRLAKRSSLMRLCEPHESQ